MTTTLDIQRPTRTTGCLWIHGEREILALTARDSSDVIVTVEGVWVFTYGGDIGEAAAAKAVSLVLDTLDENMLPGRYAPHWYPIDEEHADNIRTKLAGRPAYKPAAYIEGRPNIGDIAEFRDVDHEPLNGTVVILAVDGPADARRYEIHTKHGVLQSIPESALTVTTSAPAPTLAPMSDVDASWIRANVWTQRMRLDYKNSPAAFHACACQYGPTQYCQIGKHNACHHDVAAAPKPSCETYIVNATGGVMRFAEPFEHGTRSEAGEPAAAYAQVWLKDRTCVWMCDCGCHEMTTEIPEVYEPPKPKKAKGVQLDLFATVCGPA